HHGSGFSKRTGPRPSTDVAELAASAFSCQRAGVAKLHEQLVLAVDCPELVGAHVASHQREEPARTDIAKVVDKEKPVAVGDAARGPQAPAPDPGDADCSPG